MGAVADMVLQPWGALLIGVLAGCISVIGYNYLSVSQSSHIPLYALEETQLYWSGQVYQACMAVKHVQYACRVCSVVGIACAQIW